MLPTSDDIYWIAQNVLDTMVQVQSTPDEPRPIDDVLGHVTGCIQISGTWKGAVVLQTTQGFARSAASHMLRIDDQEVTAEDIQDAMAEITNMIGGNIKSQVPGPSFLSLPTVTTGNDFDFRLVKSHTVNDVTLDVENEPLRILLCESLQTDTFVQ